MEPVHERDKEDDDLTEGEAARTGAPIPRRLARVAAALIAAVCLVGLGVWIGRGGGAGFFGFGGETAEEYAARIASRDNLARFGFVRAELARDAGDKQAAAALKKLADDHDSTGILEWLIAKAAAEPENMEIPWEIFQLARLHERKQDAEAALRQILARNPNDIRALHSLGCMLWRPKDRTEAESLLNRACSLDPGQEGICEPCEDRIIVWSFNGDDPAYQFISGGGPTPEDRFKAMLDQFTRSGDLEGMMRQYILLANYHSMRKHDDRYLAYTNKALNFAEKLGREEYMAQLHHGLGAKFLLDGDYARCRFHFDRAEESYRRLGVSGLHFE